jgi:hypothetical protein
LKNNSKDIPINFTISIGIIWAVWIVFSLMNELSFNSRYHGTFMLFFGVSIPFVALASNPLMILGTSTLIVAIALSCQIPTKTHRRVALASALGFWNIYGIYSGAIFSGGA